MLPVGSAVVYTASEKERTVTLNRDKQELLGSHYHPTQVQFAGLVAAIDEDGKTAKLVIFPPNRNPVTIDAVAEGDAPGQFAAAASGKTVRPARRARAAGAPESEGDGGAGKPPAAEAAAAETKPASDEAAKSEPASQGEGAGLQGLIE